MMKIVKMLSLILVILGGMKEIHGSDDILFQEEEQLPLCMPSFSSCLVDATLPITFVDSIMLPFVAGFSYHSSDIALASAILNTCSLPICFLNTWASFWMEKHSNKNPQSAGQSCGCVPCISTLRNVAGLGILGGAIGTSWAYYVYGGGAYYIANTALTMVFSGMMIGGTSCMYCCLYKRFWEYQFEKDPLLEDREL